MRSISYRGELVAIATRTRVYLAPQISALPRGHPKLRFVAALCLYGRDVDTGEVSGPYDEGEGELYARTLLIPDEEFGSSCGEQDEQLVERFRVPAEQVAAKRCDINDG